MTGGDRHERVIIRDKAEYHARTTDEMQRHLTLPPWSLRQKIALTCRIRR